jgi:hypothetical protein
MAQQMYEVTVTNLTAHQVFTPLLIVSHPHDTQLFQVGQPASEALEQVAESGDTSALATELMTTGGALDVVALTEPLLPGASVTEQITTDMEASHISVIGMLVPTNDGFVALNSAHVPETSETLRVPAYDAGTEANDELCASIPGPPAVCTGEGFNPSIEGAEGFVHIHRGIHGSPDLNAATYDWRNPVAQITLQAIPVPAPVP